MSSRHRSDDPNYQRQMNEGYEEKERRPELFGDSRFNSLESLENFFPSIFKPSPRDKTHKPVNHFDGLDMTELARGILGQPKKGE